MAYTLEPVGFIRSELTRLADAPRQGDEGAPSAYLEIMPAFAAALTGINVGDELIVLTWLHEARREVLQVHPRDDLTRPLTGVFATRSPDRPNPIGLHRVHVLAIADHRLQIAPIEAIDGTPVLDVKPVLRDER